MNSVLPQVTNQIFMNKSPSLPPTTFRNKVLSFALPEITSTVSYKGHTILSEPEKKETIGFGVRSLMNAFKGEEQENYIKLLQNRAAGLFTGEEKNDLPSIRQNDRTDISTGIKLYLRKRSPLGAANRNQKDLDILDSPKVNSEKSKKQEKVHKSTAIKNYLKYGVKRNTRNQPLIKLYDKVSSECQGYSHELESDKTNYTIPQKLETLKKTSRVLQQVIKNHLLNPNQTMGNRYRKAPQVTDFIKLINYKVPECLDLTKTANREEFRRATHECTKFIGKACK